MYIVVLNASDQNFVIYCFVINLTKMKSNAFKKFEYQSYKNQINHDAKERFQKLVYIILFSLSQPFTTILVLYKRFFYLIIVGSLIDYIKHNTILGMARKLKEL